MTRIVSHSAGNIQSVRKILAVRHTESWSDFFITYEVLYNNNSEFTFVLQKIKNFLRHLKAIINDPLTVELFKVIHFMTDVFFFIILFFSEPKKNLKASAVVQLQKPSHKFRRRIFLLSNTTFIFSNYNVCKK